MEIIRGWHNVRAQHLGCVLTMGNFDGCHRGHQALLTELKLAAQNHNLPATVIIFEPQPFEFFHPEKSGARLMRLREKLEALRAVNINRVIIVRFNAAFARITAIEFIENYLCRKLGVKQIVVGDDFRFGSQRQGNINTLITAGQTFGFNVSAVDSFILAEQRVSSTRVREALGHADLNVAEQLLGHRYQMSGRVAHGDKLGRTLGFPTANIFLHRLRVPLAGIFAVRIYGIDNCVYAGVANVGTRPTVNGKVVLLEVFIFDFDREMYGQHVQVEFVKKIRDEQRFANVELMRLAMVEDVKNAKMILTEGLQ